MSPTTVGVLMLLWPVATSLMLVGTSAIVVIVASPVISATAPSVLILGIILLLLGVIWPKLLLGLLRRWVTVSRGRWYSIGHWGWRIVPWVGTWVMGWLVGRPGLRSAWWELVECTWVGRWRVVRGTVAWRRWRHVMVGVSSVTHF